MVLFVICVRLPEILYQKTPQPRCPGISGVRQPCQLMTIDVSPFLPDADVRPFPPGTDAYGWGRRRNARIFQEVTSKSILDVYDQRP